MSEKDWDKLTSGSKQISVRAGDVVVRQGVCNSKKLKIFSQKIMGTPIFFEKTMIF